MTFVIIWTGVFHREPRGHKMERRDDCSLSEILRCSDTWYLVILVNDEDVMHFQNNKRTRTSKMKRRL